MRECEYNPLLSPFFDGELNDLQQRRVERHLGYCQECAAELERLGALSVVLAVVKASPVPVAQVHSSEQRGLSAERLAMVRFVRRLTMVSATAAALALAVNYYTADEPAQLPAPAAATLSNWERAAIDPVPTDNATATASAESQFDDFLVHDLGGIQ